MGEFFETNTTRIAQLCYKDLVINKWIPVSETNTLPISTPVGKPLQIQIVGSSGEYVDVVQQPDGTNALRVDSELTLNADNISIGNIKVGSDGTVDTKPLTTEAGNLDIVSTELYTIFTDMLKELKKMNLHLAMITDIYPTNLDVEL